MHTSSAEFLWSYLNGLLNLLTIASILWNIYNRFRLRYAAHLEKSNEYLQPFQVTQLPLYSVTGSIGPSQSMSTQFLLLIDLRSRFTSLVFPFAIWSFDCYCLQPGAFPDFDCLCSYFQSWGWCSAITDIDDIKNASHRILLYLWIIISCTSFIIVVVFLIWWSTFVMLMQTQRVTPFQTYPSLWHSSYKAQLVMYSSSVLASAFFHKISLSLKEH